MIVSDHTVQAVTVCTMTLLGVFCSSHVSIKTSRLLLVFKEKSQCSRLTEKAAIHLGCDKSLPSWFTDVSHEKSPNKSNPRTSLISLPFTTRAALDVRPRAVKVISPASSGITFLILSVYFRPVLEALNRPPLSTLLPFRVQLKSPMLSWDKTHSKVQSSPSWISVFFSRLVMPIFSSGRQEVG